MAKEFDCLTCAILEPVNENLPAYARTVYEAMVEPASLIFWAGVGIWVVIVWVIRPATTGQFHFADVMKQSVYVLVASGFLVATEVFWAYSYEFTNTAMFGITKLAVLGAPDRIAGSGDNIVGMAEVIETQAMRVFYLFEKMMDDVSIHRLDLMGLSLLIVIPFLFLFTFFLGHLTASVLSIGAVAALGPFLAAAMAFGPTRGITLNAFRLALGQVLRVFFAAFSIGLTFFLIDQLFSGFPLDDGGEMIIDADEFLYSRQFWATIILGMLGVLFQWEAASLASNLAQTQISSVGPALFAAGVSRSLSTAKTAATQTVGAARQAGSSTLSGLRNLLGSGSNG